MSELDQVQKEVVTTLQELDTPASQKSIREQVGCPKSTLSTKLTRLEESNYVIDQSGFGDNSKKYVLNDEVNVETNYRFEVVRDTQLILYGVQILSFGLLVGAMIQFLGISRLEAFMMYGAFLLGVAPPLAIHIYQNFTEDDLYSIEISKQQE